MSYGDVPPATQVEPNLWLCDFYNFYDPSFLPTSGINAVLSLLDDPAPLFIRPEFANFIIPDRHLYIKCSDTKDEEFLSRFQTLCEWIERMRTPFNGREGIVLVHCEEGVSRSPCVLVAYLIWRDGVGVEQAVGNVKRQRKIVDIRGEFLGQLKIWEGWCRSEKRMVQKLSDGG